MTDKHYTFCRICEALCGLEVEVEDGEVRNIRPDRDHVVTGGFGCLKGLKQHKMYASEDRLQHPMKRVGSEWKRISWEQANEEIGTKVRELHDEDPDAIAMYVGTAAGFSTLHPIFAQGFMQGVGSRSMFASSTQDCANKFAVSRELYGFPFTLTYPDVDNTECLIIVGANPAVSKWSFLQVSNPVERLKSMARRGVSLYVVDPRYTETAKAAGTWVEIRPNTDVYFYLSFLHEVFAQDGVDTDKTSRFMKNLEPLRELAAPWTPERCEAVTRIPAAQLRQMVSDYLAADGAALYCSTGVNMGTHGALSFWLQEAINAITGNLDRRGGTLVGKGFVDLPSFAAPRGMLLHNNYSRVGNYKAVNDVLPGPILADEILTPGERQIKALFVTGGNPLITMANSARLREAFEKLELLVSVDIYLNETASVGTHVLPATSPLERPDLPFIFPFMLGLQSRPYIQATDRVIEAKGEQRDEATIYLDICKHAGIPIFGSRVAQKTLEFARWSHSRKHRNRQPAIPQEAILNLLLRLARQPGFRKIQEQHPHGQAVERDVVGTFLGQRVFTKDRRINLAPDELLAYTKSLDESFRKEQATRDELRLITKRAITTHNSWTHNIEEFVGERNRTNFLYMHPEDAAARGLSDDDVVDVSSATATVRLPLKTLDDLSRGTVALPHGWGHQHATGLSVASQTEGVNVNLLAADGPGAVDPISGMAHLTGIPVEVGPARGRRNTQSWSGL